MRIIAGKHKGRNIQLGKANGVRPTSGFAREAIFNLISHGRFAGDASPYIGKRVADICCGSGALGLEALSRGAAHVTFVDHSPESLKAARANAEHFKEEPNCRFLQADATRLPPSREPYSLIFIDPPYGGKHTNAILSCLHLGQWLDQHSLIVIEQDARDPFHLPPGYQEMDLRHYGRAAIRLLRKG